MAKRPTTTTVASGFYSTTTLNNNFTALRNGFDNTLSLDGSAPNAMNADLDMNSNDLLNVDLVDTLNLKIRGVTVTPTNVQFFQSTDTRDNVSELLSDTEFTYSSGVPNKIQVVAGDILRTLAEGFAYEVAASGATDHHVTTAGGVKLYVLPSESGMSIEAFGAVASADQATASANVTAIRKALIAGVAFNATVVVPNRDLPFLVNDNFTIDSTLNGLRWKGDGKLKFANVMNPANIISVWMININDRVTAISDVRIEGLQLDGNRSSITLSGSTPATSFGVWLDQRTLLGDGVEINNVTANNFVTSGFQIQQGPIVLRFPTARGNGAHGVGFQNDPLGMLFQGWASIISPRTSDCEGYGIDFTGGKVLCTDHVDEGSWYGNAKASVGLEHLILRGAHWSNSPGNPADPISGRGFLTTGTAAQFANTILDMDGVYIEGAASASFVLGGFDGQVSLGSIVVRNGNPALISVEQGDIQIAATKFEAAHLETHGSDANGVVITAGCTRYSIGYVESRRASRAGFTVRATTGACDGVIGRAVMRENNQAGLTAAAAAAIQHIVAGNTKISNAIIEDTQGVPTQVSGMYFGGGVQAEVNDCHFGAGIAANQQVYSVTAGTRVRFGRNNTGIVTFARGTRTGNGGSTTQNVTFPVAMTTLGGAVFYGLMTPASADASGAHHITGVFATAMNVSYAVAPPAGTNNVSYRYDAEMEIQR